MENSEGESHIIWELPVCLSLDLMDENLYTLQIWGVVQIGHFVWGICTELCYCLYTGNCHRVLKDLVDELSLF